MGKRCRLAVLAFALASIAAAAFGQAPGPLGPLPYAVRSLEVVGETPPIGILLAVEAAVQRGLARAAPGLRRLDLGEPLAPASPHDAARLALELAERAFTLPEAYKFGDLVLTQEKFEELCDCYLLVPSAAGYKGGPRSCSLELRLSIVEARKGTVLFRSEKAVSARGRDEYELVAALYDAVAAAIQKIAAKAFGPAGTVDPIAAKNWACAVAYRAGYEAEAEARYLVSDVTASALLKAMSAVFGQGSLGLFSSGKRSLTSLADDLGSTVVDRFLQSGEAKDLLSGMDGTANDRMDEAAGELFILEPYGFLTSGPSKKKASLRCELLVCHRRTGRCLALSLRGEGSGSSPEAAAAQAALGMGAEAALRVALALPPR